MKHTPAGSTPLPTVAPTAVPTSAPTAALTAVPTAAPTAAPTAMPTAVPTAVPTAAPTAPTTSPTTQPFPMDSIKVTIATKLSGFTTATFTLGPQVSYRKTIAAMTDTTVNQVLLSNIRATARRLSSGAGGIDFDTSISVDDAASATSTEKAITSVTPVEIKSKFVTELEAAKASGKFADLAAVNIAERATAIIISKQITTTACTIGQWGSWVPEGACRTIVISGSAVGTYSQLMEGTMSGGRAVFWQVDTDGTGRGAPPVGAPSYFYFLPSKSVWAVGPVTGGLRASMYAVGDVATPDLGACSLALPTARVSACLAHVPAYP
jgi:hypothetical protein